MTITTALGMMVVLALGADPVPGHRQADCDPDHEQRDREVDRCVDTTVEKPTEREPENDRHDDGPPDQAEARQPCPDALVASSAGLLVAMVAAAMAFVNALNRLVAGEAKQSLHPQKDAVVPPSRPTL